MNEPKGLNVFMWNLACFQWIPVNFLKSISMIENKDMVSCLNAFMWNLKFVLFNSFLLKFVLFNSSILSRISN